MNSKKFLIFAPSFREDDGGGIVLHRLCALLNEIGYEAYVSRLFDGEPVYPNNFVRPLFTLIKRGIWRSCTRFKTNLAWDTPRISATKRSFGSDWVVVYPEIVFGNPLNATNVVRWFLFKPGFHSGRIYYGDGEYHIDFNSFAGQFSYPGAHNAKFPLNVLSFPFEYYNLKGALGINERVGTAYCLRKGKGKLLVHELNDSVLIDGKSHAEVAAIFKRVKRFISYDTHTAYSSFAVLCGAESIVIPDSGISKENWYPDEADRYGVAYGLDDLEWAERTASKVLVRMKAKEDQSRENVRRFAHDVLVHFKA